MLFGGFAYVGTFLRDRYQLAYVTIGLLLGGFGVGGLLYSASVRQLVKRLGETGMIRTGGLLMALGYLAIALIPTWLAFIPASVFMGLGFYMFHSTLQTQATELTPASRGTAVSLFAFCLFMGQGLGAAILGQVVDRAGYVPSFLLAGLTILLLSLWLVSQWQ